MGDDHGPWDEGTLEFAGLSRVRLDSLPQELLSRVDEMLDSQDWLRSLLDAVVSIGTDLDLNSALDRIVHAACELSGARYGAGFSGPTASDSPVSSRTASPRSRSRRSGRTRRVTASSAS